MRYDQYRGYPFEEHVVRTEDGYLLVLHRIPGGRTGAGFPRNSRYLTPSYTSTQSSGGDISADDTSKPHRSSMRRRQRCRTLPNMKGLNVWQDMFPLPTSGYDTPGETDVPTPLASSRTPSNDQLPLMSDSSRPRSLDANDTTTEHVLSVSEQRRPPILLMHGFMMCSEVWCSTPDANLCLPFFLADLGYRPCVGVTLLGHSISLKYITLGMMFGWGIREATNTVQSIGPSAPMTNAFGTFPWTN